MSETTHLFLVADCDRDIAVLHVFDSDLTARTATGRPATLQRYARMKYPGIQVETDLNGTFPHGSAK